MQALLLYTSDTQPKALLAVTPPTLPADVQQGGPPLAEGSTTGRQKSFVAVSAAKLRSWCHMMSVHLSLQCCLPVTLPHTDILTVHMQDGDHHWQDTIDHGTGVDKSGPELPAQSAIAVPCAVIATMNKRG